MSANYWDMQTRISQRLTQLLRSAERPPTFEEFKRAAELIAQEEMANAIKFEAMQVSSTPQISLSAFEFPEYLDPLDADEIEWPVEDRK